MKESDANRSPETREGFQRTNQMSMVSPYIITDSFISRITDLLHLFLWSYHSMISSIYNIEAINQH